MGIQSRHINKIYYQKLDYPQIYRPIITTNWYSFALFYNRAAMFFTNLSPGSHKKRKKSFHYKSLRTKDTNNDNGLLRTTTRIWLSLSEMCALLGISKQWYNTSLVTLTKRKASDKASALPYHLRIPVEIQRYVLTMHSKRLQGKGKINDGFLLWWHW